MAFLVTTCLSFSLCILLFHTGIALNKYSFEANEPKYMPTLRELDKPFRMAKLNVLWVKAKNVSINILQSTYIYMCFKKIFKM